MYVTGSDAWNSQKQVSEGRIGGQSRSEVAQGLPEQAGSGNQSRGLICAGNATFAAQSPEPFAYCGLAPILGA